MCQSFPTKDWIELSPEDRRFILRWETRQFPPLRMPDVLWEPRVWAMHTKFKALAETAVPPIEEVKPGQPGSPMPYAPAMLQKGGSVYYCVFEVDFSESRDSLKEQFVAWLHVLYVTERLHEHKKQRSATGTPLRQRKMRRYFSFWKPALYWCLFEVDLSARKGDLVKQFAKWLRAPENRKRLARYAKGKRGTTGDLLDRLKDLAAWRLYREYGNSCEQANKFAGDHRKTKLVTVLKGKPPMKIGRPFHNARALKNDPLVPTNLAGLFSCDAEYRTAQGRVLKHLADCFPAEFKIKKPTLPPALKRLFQAG